MVVEDNWIFVTVGYNTIILTDSQYQLAISLMASCSTLSGNNSFRIATAVGYSSGKSERVVGGCAASPASPVAPINYAKKYYNTI